MSRQLSLDTFLNKKLKKSSISKGMTDISRTKTITKAKIKFNLSLTKSPIKSQSIKNETQVINLCSDDDEFSSGLNDSALTPNLDSSNSSQGTVPYSLTPESAAYSQTPLKTPKSLSSLRLSPSSSGKYYSPTKKRIVTKRSPVKRKLELEFDSLTPVKGKDNVKDDKTQALMNIIRQCLEKGSLKMLLAEECQMLLNRCLSVQKPGMRLVCRFYWRKPGWYRAEQLKAIVGQNQVDEASFQLMLESLIASGLVVNSYVDNSSGNLTFDDLASILKSDELKLICKDLKLKIQSKQDAIDALRSYCRKSSIGNYFTGISKSNEGRVLKIMSQRAGPCFKLSELARGTLDKLHVLMYLGINYSIIREKRLEVTILYDKIKRETYPVDENMELDDASVVFQNREQFDRYFTAHCIYENFLERTDQKEKCEIVKKVYELYKGICEGEMLCYKALPPWLRRFTPANVYVKILEAGVLELKKNKTTEDYTLSVEILTSLINQIGFRQHKKADWYAEKALILYNLEQYDEVNKYGLFPVVTTGVVPTGDNREKKIPFVASGDKWENKIPVITSDDKWEKEHPNRCQWKCSKLKTPDYCQEAAKVLLEGLNSSLPEHAKDSLRPRVRKVSARAENWLSALLIHHADKDNTLEKNLPACHVYKQPMDRTTQRGKVKFETRLESARVVQDAEQYCMSHYIQTGEFTHGGHWEGSIITTIFFLLFWDIIYTKPRGATGIFLTRYQMYPLDMFCENFYTNRQTLVEERLAFIELGTTEEMLDMMHDKWNSRDECELSGINRSIGWENISAVCRCLGAAGVGAVCRRLAAHYWYTQSGFPDLTLWNVHTGKIKFVEVKTDSDKPSMKQIQWMHYLRENGIEAEFCYVGANTTRCKARAS